MACKLRSNSPNGKRFFVIGVARPGAKQMRKNKGFSLIELLIVVATILIIAAIAIPSLLRARMAANEASAVSSLRTINSAEITYQSTYPTNGYADLLSLGNTLGTACPNPPTSAQACLIDSALANNGQPAGSGKSGYSFAATPSGAANARYLATAVPQLIGASGQRSFCSNSDAVVRQQPTGAAIGSVAACAALSPLSQ